MPENINEDAPTTEVTPEVVEEPKVKIGDVELAESEARDLLELGKIAKEAEEKYERPISKYWPEYTRTKQENEALKAELDKVKTQPTTVSADPQDPEAQRRQAIEAAEKLGLLHQGNIKGVVENIVAGYRLMDETRSVLSGAKADGKPVPAEDELLSYMEETGIKNPQTAYKVMYEEQLAKWNTEQMSKVKPKGMTTQESSTAGAKQPAPPAPVTDEKALKSALSSIFNKGQGA